MKKLITLILFTFTFSGRSDCDLRKFDNYLTGLENSIYINRQEKEPAIYRGIATTKGQALEMAFKDIKAKKCPDKDIKCLTQGIKCF
jgi:hypothetical protein